MSDSRIDRRAFLEMVARGVPSLVALGAALQITSIGWTGTRYSLTMVAHAENEQGAVAPAATRIIDTHAHLQARGPHHPRATTAVRLLKPWKLWIAKGINRTIIMPPPFGPDSPRNDDFEDFPGAIGQQASRFSYLGWRNPQSDASRSLPPGDRRGRSGTELRNARPREIVAGGALGFGEMSCEHLSFNPHHPYTFAPPDHPLMLRLAEIAAHLGVFPIDLHMEAVRADMPTPPRFLERSPNNPPTLKANIDRFRTLPASNRKAPIIRSHAG